MRLVRIGARPYQQDHDPLKPSLSAVILRFAPSPNGEMHLGHALSALTNHDLARAGGGTLLLRIEDIDTTRCTPEFEAGIHRDLQWLGVEWAPPARRQSEHFAVYRDALERLKAMGLVYPAFMSRGEIRAHIAEAEAKGAPWPRDPDGAPLYPDADKRLNERQRKARMAEGAPYSWRLDMERAVEQVAANLRWTEFNPGGGQASIPASPGLWGDVILARSDIPTSYNLSVVVDDALQGVTHVVRGKDLFHATSVHRLLQSLLGLPEPVYHHHRLILDADGRKLSKSEKSTGLRVLREAGVTPTQIRDRVGLPDGRAAPVQPN